MAEGRNEPPHSGTCRDPKPIASEPCDLVERIVNELGPAVGLNSVALAMVRETAVAGAKRDPDGTRSALARLRDILVTEDDLDA